MLNISKIYNLSLFLIVISFSLLVNVYYSNFGVEPMDSFVLYNGGYKVLNNLVPFKDYWLVTGPLMDYLNAFFFKINGTSWKSFIIHSSLVNAITSTLIFILFLQFNLNKIFSLVYTLMFSLLMYPSVGVPFVDHHATILVMVSFCLFILGVKKNDNKYFFLIPLFLILGFLCKQTPTTYGVIAMFVLGLFYLIKNNNPKKFLFSVFSGVLLSLFFLYFFFLITGIPISNFLTQYIFFASSIGDYRLANWNFDLSGTIHEYKFIIVPLIYIFYLTYLHYKQKNKEDFIILLSLIFFTFLILFHQILTMNENYIFFIIPIITAFIHIYSKENKNSKNIVLYLVIALCVFSVTKYHFRYNESRKFHRLENVDLKKAVDAKIIDSQLSGLKWITKTYKDNPKEEIKNIVESLEVLRGETGNYSIITEYLFISPILNINDNSPNQWYHPGVSFPLKESKYFSDYKNFFIEKLKKNKITKVIIVGNSLEDLLDSTFEKNCFAKSQLSKITFKLELKKNCKDFK